MNDQPPDDDGGTWLSGELHVGSHRASLAVAIGALAVAVAALAVAIAR